MLPTQPFLLHKRVICKGDTYLPWGEISLRELTPFQMNDCSMFSPKYAPLY